MKTILLLVTLILACLPLHTVTAASVKLHYPNCHAYSMKSDLAVTPTAYICEHNDHIDAVINR